MSLWDSLFNHLRQPIAQILLTRNDIADVSDLHVYARSVVVCVAWLTPVDSGHDTSMLKTPSMSY